MTSPAAALSAVATALDQVTGLRCHSTHPGNVTTPAAICEIVGITAPSTLGTAVEYEVQVYLLLQVGDKRNSQDRTLDMVDPNGTSAASAFAALLTHDPIGQVRFRGPGLVPYGETSYHGGIFTVTVNG